MMTNSEGYSNIDKPASSLIPIPLIKKLLHQHSLSDLVSVLNHDIAPFVEADHITLLLWDAAHQSLQLNSHDPLQNSLSQQTMRASIHCFSSINWLIQHYLHCDQQQFASQHQGLMRLFPYHHMVDYYLFPLGNQQNPCFAGIEFIKNTHQPFSAITQTRFHALSELVSLVLENVLYRENCQKEVSKLKQINQQSQILVDVTNAIITSLDLNVLAVDISKAIHRFFHIEYISIALAEQGKQHVKLYNTSYKQGNYIATSTKQMLAEDSLLRGIIDSRKTVVIDIADTIKRHPNREELASLFNNDLRVLCLIPLIFGNNVLGVLKLAQQSPTFNQDNLFLLQQIAARMAISIDNALAYEEITRLKEQLIHENHYLTEQINDIGNFAEIIGHSQAIKNVLEKIEMVASSDCNVLILGETGTGKELVAQAVHNLSQRKNKRMVKLNCAAIPSGLLESDLFGHEKGAFTGATSQRMGRFELADKSSLFLDEVGDIPLELQPKLLRALQEREIERLGSNKIIPVDVRLIAATNRNLKKMVEDREYRSDLYYRLNVFPIVIPSLRERAEDIPLLAKFFTQKFAKRMNKQIDSIPIETLQMLKGLPLFGNVRELQNIIERAVILTKGNILNLQIDELHYHSSPQFEASSSQPITQCEPPVSGNPDHLCDERELIIRTLQQTNGIVAGPRGAAARLGLKRTTLLSRMQKMGISPKSYPSE